ncbi:MAG: hypothetical protein WKF37_10840 [Bryobacteraceae bacterium]
MDMARGWESKSVESQIESAEERRLQRSQAAQVTLEHSTRLQAQKSLEMSRARVLHDLEAAKHPRHRDQLQAALDHLDAKLRELG